MRPSLALVLAAAAAPLPAQAYWHRQTPACRYGHAMAYDSQRQRVVLFGGYGEQALTDTWEWDGVAWTRRLAPTTPPLAQIDGMAFDAARRVCVLVGRQVGGVCEIWEWDGTDWRAGARMPGNRRDGAVGLAYDPLARVTVVLVASSILLPTETWLWDGSQWAQAAGPSAGAVGPMAYDAVRARCVTWTNGYTAEWDGTVWRTLVPPLEPQLSGHSLAFDPSLQRVVAVGLGPSGSEDLWDWDGRAWQQRGPLGVPPAGRCCAGVATDTARRRLVLVGGADRAFSGDTQEWDGSRWLLRQDDAGPARTGHAVAYDRLRRRIVLFGGADSAGVHSGDTWEWDGLVWTLALPALSPAARSGAALAYDSARQRTVLFGGQGPLGDLGDTWEWDGIAWSMASPAQSPSPRSGSAIVYDAQRQRVLLFGGSASGTPSTETWEWDGRAWSLLATRGPALASHALTFDPLRGQAQLVGESLGARVWVWQGGSWRQVPAAAGPWLVSMSVTHDEARQRTVLLGMDRSSSRTQTCDWDGTAWTQTASGPLWSYLGTPPLCFDAGRERVVAYGFATLYNVLATHLLEHFSDWPASWSAFGAGCGVFPTLTAIGRPWLGDAWTLSAAGLPGSGAAALALGASSIRWGRVPLPYPLGLLGFPACSVQASLDWPLTLGPGSAASLVLPLPLDPRLAGCRLFAQVLAVDAMGGLSLSAGGAAVLGLR